MSCIYKCDRCGKIINPSDSIRSKGNGEYEIAAASRIVLTEGNRHYDLCLECKIELYNWMHGSKEESK